MKPFFVEIESKPQMLNKKIESLCGELKQVIKEHEYFYRLKGMYQTDKLKHKNTIAYLINTYSILKAANTMLLSAIINDVNETPARGAAAEKFFKKTHSMIDKPIGDWASTLFQADNNQCAQKTQTSHSTHAESAKNSSGCLCCEHSSSQRQKDKPTLGAEHGRSRTPLGNSDQIVIQIPKGLKISSMKIEFDQEPSEYLGRCFVESF